MDWERRAARLCERVLAREGPLPLAQLAQRLAADGLRLPPGLDPGSWLGEILGDAEGLYHLPDGRIASLEALFDGVVVTHRLTAGEAADGVVAVEPDLTLLLAAADADPEGVLALAGGGSVEIAPAGAPESDVAGDHPFAGRWAATGPPGWLGGAAPGDLLGFRLAGGFLAVDRVEAGPDDEATGRRLAHAFAAAEADGEPVPSSAVVLIARADAPGLLERPLRPVPELLGRFAGLEVHGEWVGAPGTDWDEVEADALAVDEARAVFGLDDEGVEALELVLGAFELARQAGTDVATAVAGQDEDEEDALHALAHALSWPGVAEAFVSTTFGTDPDDEPLARELAETVARACDGASGPRLVLARCAEHRGDILAAEAHLADALKAEPDDETALLDAAWYAEDRGDAATALAYLRQAEADDDHDTVARLERFAAPGRASTGRNEPCPCGSGRKHKVCCGPRNGHPLPDRAGWLWHKAVTFLLRPGQRMRLHNLAVARTGADPDDPVWVGAALHDPLVHDLGLFDAGGLVAFLDARGVLLPADELALGRDWAGSAGRTLYEVVEVGRDDRLGLREVDLEGQVGPLVTVLRALPNATGSAAAAGGRHPAAGRLLYGRVVAAGLGQQLLVGPVQVPEAARDPLLGLLAGDPGPVELAAWFAAAGIGATLGSGRSA
jgi:tetratricopeptide (TPR) repeat protein